MINLIRSILNRNKKLYVIVHSKLSKGKLARVCYTLGQFNPQYRYSRVIMVKPETNECLDILLEDMKEKRFKISGTHIDAGLTQVTPMSLLGFSVIVDSDKRLEFKLL